MRKGGWGIMAGLVLAALPAFAGVNDKVTTATLTNVSGNCLALNRDRISLTLDGSASAVNLGYCEGAGCTASIGTAGTTTLLATAIHYWPAGSAPTAAFCFVATSGSQPFTIREGTP